MTVYNISLVGFGGVNRALAELIAAKNDEWEKELGFGLNIVGVSDLHFGSVISPNGIDARTLVETRFEKGGFVSLSGGSAEASTEQMIRNAPADFVVEATFTNPSDGEPALSFCRLALECGRHVVTTNKGPVAFAASKLKALAEARNVSFAFEGSVMSGTPTIRLATQALAGANIRGFEGILNGTSNYILSQMENGEDFATALAQAQKFGYAEADPTADIEGHDVRLKVAILANELFCAGLEPLDIACRGISGITSRDIGSAQADGCRWKLVGAARLCDDGTVLASVSPRRLPLGHPLAGIGGAVNAVTFTTEMLGHVTLSGPGAGRIETAYALLSDIIAIHRRNAACDKGAK